jgi:thioredoxin reductase
MGSTAERLFDVLIVGGGAAGLSAALILGRARRTVLVIDDAQPRNSVVEFSHGFLTRDGIPPAELIRLGRADLSAYPTVELMNDSALSVKTGGDTFTLSIASGATVVGKRLIIASGVFDQLPRVDGLAERWGKSIFVCPFCDGWEVRDQRIAVYGKGRDAVELAQEIHGWTTDLIICIQRDDLTDQDRLWIGAAGARLRVGTLRALFGPNLSPMKMLFENGDEESCEALLISAPLRQHSPLFAALGCEIGSDGLVVVDSQSLTTVAGCYAAGDAVTARHQIVISAASGAAAAISLNSNLLEAEAHELVAAAGGHT